MAIRPGRVDRLRAVFLWPLALLNTAFWAMLSLAASVLPGSHRVQHWCMRWWSRMTLSLGGVSVRVFGLEKVDAHGPRVIVSNHQSLLDILVLAAVLPCRFGWVAKASLFKIPFLGWHMTRAGYVPIDRGRRTASARLLLRAVNSIRAGHSVAIFPEQTRSEDGRLGDFHGGAALLAIRSEAPILPVVIRGTGRALPKRSLVVRRGRVVVEILDPIPTRDIAPSDKAAMTERLRSLMAGRLDEETPP